MFIDDIHNHYDQNYSHKCLMAISIKKLKNCLLINHIHNTCFNRKPCRHSDSKILLCVLVFTITCINYIQIHFLWSSLFSETLSSLNFSQPLVFAQLLTHKPFYGQSYSHKFLRSIVFEIPLTNYICLMVLTKLITIIFFKQLIIIIPIHQLFFKINCIHNHTDS
jgi:hypothetical protein